MGILSSLYTGVTGIQANGEALGVISDNIANANTIGFKTSRAEFADVVAKSLKGILGGNQIGRGTKLQAVTPIFSQGSVNQTDKSTDLAITGDGFFVMDGPEGRAFSRNGSFNFNSGGELVNSDGLQVKGFRADEEGKISTQLDSIKVERTIIDAKRTENVNISMNLDIRADKIEKEFDLADPVRTSNYSTGITVYDSAGNAHNITMYFRKQEDSTWNWYAVAKGEEIVGGEKGKGFIGATGTLNYTVDGKLQNQVIGQNSFNFTKGALPDQQVKFNFGDDIMSGGTGLKGSTQYGSVSDIYKHTQDGYTAGTIGGLSFNDDGVLSAFYTNGVTKNLAQIAVAKFENNEGLFKAGNNLFKESRNSGSPNIGGPNTAGRGKVFSKSIEASATDIASEFVNLIQMQRAFQANSRTLSTSDEMMQEVLNIKRG
ncbi:MAG: flagellar hook protein FlgE [Bdellovibrionales bacterium]|nr:flagellar hook protein FlgE [Bdellovibrionales bacterium]